jgi:hypothetical protein
VYDYRLFSGYDANGGSAPWPLGERANLAYLRRADVQKALHVHVKGVTKLDNGNQPPSPPLRVLSCDDAPYTALVGDTYLSSRAQLTRLLDAGMRMWLYHGQFDFVCNHVVCSASVLQ